MSLTPVITDDSPVPYQTGSDVQELKRCSFSLQFLFNEDICLCIYPQKHTKKIVFTSHFFLKHNFPKVWLKTFPVPTHSWSVWLLFRLSINIPDLPVVLLLLHVLYVICYVLIKLSVLYIINKNFSVYSYVDFTQTKSKVSVFPLSLTSLSIHEFCFQYSGAKFCQQ